MSVRVFRSPNEPDNTDSVYDKHPELFTILVHHYGEFTKPPKRIFYDGRSTYVDYVHVDELSSNMLDKIMEELGYVDCPKWFYYFKKFDDNLDTGLRLLSFAEEEVSRIIMYAKLHREIEIYVTRKGVNEGPFLNYNRLPIWNNGLGGASCSKRLFD